MPDPPKSTWPDFHIAVISKGGTLYPSFPSKQISGGDADKITLLLIREVARISEKLRFSADGETVLSDETSLSYYMSLKAINIKREEQIEKKAGKVDAGEKGGEAGEGAQKVTVTVKVDLILGAAGASPPAAGGDSKGPTLAETVKFQEDIDKLIQGMQGGNAVKLGDLTRLSATLGALKTDSMNFAASATKDKFTEPIDLTEQQWDQIFRNNRALNGWYFKGNVLVKARKRAFNLSPSLAENNPPPAQKAIEGPKDETKGDDATASGAQKQVSSPKATAGPLPPIPPFYVYDDSSVEVTEMTSALENQMAQQAFSSLAVRASGGGGAEGAQATGALAFEHESSTANKQLQASQVNSVHISYKFPRAAVELDTYCLDLTDECKKQALACRNRADVDRWEREYGSVFATQFTLGGELTSTRFFQSTDSGELSAFKDSVKIAAGLSISSPNASGGGSIASSEGKEGSQSERRASQSARLAWQARGGDTLLCSNPPLWASTVKNYLLWRIMDQQGIVGMIDFIKIIHPQSGRFLESPMTASKTSGDPGKADANAWALLSSILKQDSSKDTVTIKSFYESPQFDFKEFNDSLGEDGTDLKLTSKISWGELDLEQKIYIGLMCKKKGLILKD
ncbi:hypothetical protein JMJ35_007054 [Cladonia borealis]|uniref:MACPF domain-containing protein n=1 Tax=Cladonia borealis TaxID=184061 RepID=A0AA39QWN1_9LECA|nr:hypothetical protein JMJ35_007054 [Cladonia borealis]